MKNIYINDTDHNDDPLTQSLTKLSIVEVNTTPRVAESFDVIDLTLDSDSSSDKNDDFKCFKTDDLPDDVIESIRTEDIPIQKSFRDFVPICIDNIPITETLLTTLLQSTSWLNDEMINAFFKLLGASYPNSIFMNSFFFSSLVSGLNVHGWIKKSTSGKSLFEYDQLLFPINHDNIHWSLGVIYLKELEMVHYDSLGSSIGKIKCVYSNLLKILKKEAADYDLSCSNDLKLSVKAGVSPRQMDGNSCGVHTCITAHRIAQKCPLNFTTDQVYSYRFKMANNLALK